MPSLPGKSSKVPPGIGRIQSLLAFERAEKDYSRVYVELWKRFGYVSSTYLPMKRHLFFHPDHVKKILKDNHKNYTKSSDYDAMRPALGNGLVTSEGALWRRQRAAIAPVFQHSKAINTVGTITEAAKDLIEEWHASARNGEVREIHSDMVTLGFRIVGETLFGRDLKKVAGSARDALNTAIESAAERMMAIIHFPLSFPTPLNRRYLGAVKSLENIIYDIINKRELANTTQGDLLSRLTEAMSENAENSLDKRLLRDELMTLLTAGHETTAGTLSWAIMSIARNQEVVAKLEEEIERVLSGRMPTAEDLDKLEYTRMVIRETMRTIPPVPMLPRCAVEADEIGGYHVPAGAVVTCVQTVTHNDPAFWENPSHFLPERFAKGWETTVYPFSYFPFGAGPRICLGESMAMTEMVVLLACFVQQFKFELDPKHVIIPQAAITMRPKTGIRVKLLSRNTARVHDTVE